MVHMTVATVMDELKRKGTAQTKKIYGRHGMDPERLLGVSSGDMKAIAKRLRGQQGFAMELYETGMMEAMYVAGMVANGASMSEEQLQAWAEGSAGLQMIAEYTVPWVAVEHAKGRVLALKWMKSADAHMAAVGWRVYAGLLATKPDSELDLEEIEKLLGTVVKKIGKADNRLRHAMNSFVIVAGSYVAAMTEKALSAAAEIGEVEVDMGETSCRVPLASEAIGKVESRGKIGKKKKTLRC
jgi:3-methyladenine DNA glycosylase AlkD